MSICQTVIITGGCGFLGEAIARSIVQAHPEWKIILCDKRHQIPSNLLRPHDEFRLLDITIEQDVLEAFASLKPTAVVHTAALIPDNRYSRTLWQAAERVNVHGTRNVVEAAKAAGCEALVYTSSCAAVTDDMTTQHPNIDERWPAVISGSVYGDSKTLAEAIVLTASDPEMATCVLRPAPLFGEGDNITVSALHACIARNETSYKIGDGHNLYDFAHVDNAAHAHLLAVENLLQSRTAAGEIFFISNKEPVYFRDFCLAIWKEFGHIPTREVYIPQSIAYAIATVVESLSRFRNGSPALSRAAVNDACKTQYYDNSKAEEILGYETKVGLEEGIRRSCAAYMRRMAEDHVSTSDQGKTRRI